MLLLKLLFPVVAALALSGCGWSSVEIPMPSDTPPVVYERKPFSYMVFVGTEQKRRLRINGQGEVELPVQMGGREPVNVYLARDSSGARLYFDEGAHGTIVDLEVLNVSERVGTADTMGRFIGSLQSPEITDLHFVTASASPPVRFRP